MDPGTIAFIASALLPMLFGGKNKGEEELEELMKLLGPDYKFWASRSKELYPYLESFLKEGAGKYLGEGLGDFEWSGDTTSLISSLQERMGSLLKYPRGITPEERQMVINYTLGGAKRTEGARMESKRRVLSRMGLLGTGGELEEMEKERRATGEQEALIRTGIGIDELDRRYKELMGTNEMSSALLSRLLETEQIPELLSSARRGEERSYLNTLMNFFGLTKEAGAQTLQPYLQSIFNQMAMEEGGGLDWLPILVYMLTSKSKKPTTATTTE